MSQLASFISAAQLADVLLWLLYVSLTLAGLVVLLLAARMVVLRRSTELALIRARGASLWRLAAPSAARPLSSAFPPPCAAVALAVLAVPAAGGLQPAGATGAWWRRGGAAGRRLRPRPHGRVAEPAARNRAVGRRQQRARVRPVAEASLILAAVAGIVIFRQQGLQAGSGVNLYTSAAPALIAIPAVIVVFRLYPLVLRLLLRSAARTSGAPAFLGLARAARTALTPALPAFALVLTLTVAAFGGMVRDAVTNGEVAASWRAVGADATVTPSPAAPSFTIPAATARAIAGVPGVTHAARVYQALALAQGTEVTGLAVDPADYAALVAAPRGTRPYRPGCSRRRPARTRRSRYSRRRPPPPRSETAWSRSARRSRSAPVNVRVAGTLPSTPALPSALQYCVHHHAARRAEVLGHAADADPAKRGAADRVRDRPRAADRGGEKNLPRRHSPSAPTCSPG